MSDFIKSNCQSVSLTLANHLICPILPLDLRSSVATHGFCDVPFLPRLSARCISRIIAQPCSHINAELDSKRESMAPSRPSEPKSTTDSKCQCQWFLKDISECFSNVQNGFSDEGKKKSTIYKWDIQSKCQNQSNILFQQSSRGFKSLPTLSTQKS